MFRQFTGKTADDVWQEIARAIRGREGVTRQPSRVGQTLEILHAATSLSSPRDRWVVSRQPAINPAFAIAEVIWIIAGRNDSAFVNYFNRALPRYAGSGPTYHGAYGYRLRRNLKMDQLEAGYHTLVKRPESRQIVLQIWDGRLDLPRIDGKERSPDIPCNVVSMLKVRQRALDWTQIIRSNDLFRGLPYNFVQFTMLQEIMAGWLNLDVGEHNQITDSLHVYEDCLEYVESSAPVYVSPNMDSLALPWEESKQAFGKLERNVEIVIDEQVSPEKVASLPKNSEIPQ